MAFFFFFSFCSFIRDLAFFFPPLFFVFIAIPLMDASFKQSWAPSLLFSVFASCFFSPFPAFFFLFGPLIDISGSDSLCVASWSI